MKHGAYIGGQEQMTDAELVAAALQASSRISEGRAKRIAALEVEKATLCAKAERLAPEAAGFGPGSVPASVPSVSTAYRRPYRCVADCAANC